MKEKNLFKFRAWDKNNQRWMTPEVEDYEESEIRLDLWGNVEFTPPWWEQGGNTIYTVDGSDMFDIMQSTRLKDKYGTEIYEGDILHFGPFETHSNDRIVEFVDGAYYGKLIRSGYSKLLAECVYETKVIGNIYENPELLEVAE